MQNVVNPAYGFLPCSANTAGGICHAEHGCQVPSHPKGHIPPGILERCFPHCSPWLRPVTSMAVPPVLGMWINCSFDMSASAPCCDRCRALRFAARFAARSCAFGLDNRCCRLWMVAMGLQQSFQHVLPSSAVCSQALAERRAQVQSHESADAALLCATGCNDDSRLRLSTWAWTAHSSMVLPSSAVLAGCPFWDIYTPWDNTNPYIPSEA